jgi:hypothetical protein
MSSAGDAIRRLADRPWTLFCVLLALNAIARPCSVTAHDARLYSLQALNFAEHGAFADDVFLRFGSQDQFTLFSRTVGPLVAAVGLRPAFFLLYLIFNTLFIFALFRLVRALVDDALIATLALVFLVTAPLSYGGCDIFTVHEQFFTPRLVGTTFTLFALERTLRERYLAALAFLIAGSLLHPLMAFGGVMIWAGCLASTYLPSRVLGGLIVAAAIAGTVILTIPALGVRIFGAIDDDWHHTIRVAVGYNYPDTWTAKDWINLAVSFALPILACLSLYRDDPIRRRYLWIVVYAGAAGFLTTLAASYLPYALLFQGQPYRVLWILKVLQAPLGFMLIARWSQSSALLDKLAALALAGFFCVTHYVPQELWIFVLALPISILIGKMREESWWYAGTRGLVLGALGWMLFRGGFFLLQRDAIAQHFDFNEIALYDLIGPIFVIVALCLSSVWLAAQNPAALRWAALSVAAISPIGLFAAEHSAAIRERCTRHGSDIAFVRAFLDERRDNAARIPAVYSSIDRTDLIWIDLHATSYFGIIQTAGVMFNQRTADEIERRALLVNRFEMYRERQSGPFMNDGKRIGMENLFQIPLDSPDPTREDLVRLCHEPGLDYVVIPHEFPGLYSATNGRVFVYECYQVRAACERPVARGKSGESPS